VVLLNPPTFYLSLSLSLISNSPVTKSWEPQGSARITLIGDAARTAHLRSVFFVDVMSAGATLAPASYKRHDQT
jgi:hypothetical protein